MSQVAVDLPSHHYDIQIADGMLARAVDFIHPLLKRDFVTIVTDKNVGDIYLADLEKVFADHKIKTASITLPAGEKTKSWPYLIELCDKLLEAKVEREDIVIALGGGVIGDLVGFAAAILRRGVRFVQMPTSLLAQVDSSVGGKTGINADAGKNLIGAFHQPALVLTDTNTLKTLPHREFLSGYAEVAKYGLIGDEAFFAWLESEVQPILGLENDTLTKLITHSCQMKTDIVVRDEKEHGERAFLNLGHTFGHALERVTGYSDRLLHGEGVSIGMILAYKLSERLKFCKNGTSERIIKHFRAMGMKTSLKDIDGEGINPNEILDAMYQDKKVKMGSLVFVLPRRIGEVFLTDQVSDQDVLALFEDELNRK